MRHIRGGRKDEQLDLPSPSTPLLFSAVPKYEGLALAVLQIPPRLSICPYAPSARLCNYRYISYLNRFGYPDYAYPDRPKWSTASCMRRQPA